MKTSKPVEWKKKFAKVIKIAETPIFNRGGIFKQYKTKELEFEPETDK